MFVSTGVQGVVVEVLVSCYLGGNLSHHNNSPVGYILGVSTLFCLSVCLCMCSLSVIGYILCTIIHVSLFLWRVYKPYTGVLYILYQFRVSLVLHNGSWSLIIDTLLFTHVSITPCGSNWCLINTT